MRGLGQRDPVDALLDIDTLEKLLSELSRVPPGTRDTVAEELDQRRAAAQAAGRPARARFVAHVGQLARRLWAQEEPPDSGFERLVVEVSAVPGLFAQFLALRARRDAFPADATAVAEEALWQQEHLSTEGRTRTMTAVCMAAGDPVSRIRGRGFWSFCQSERAQTLERVGAADSAEYTWYRAWALWHGERALRELRTLDVATRGGGGSDLTLLVHSMAARAHRAFDDHLTSAALMLECRETVRPETVTTEWLHFERALAGDLGHLGRHRAARRILDEAVRAAEQQAGTDPSLWVAEMLEARGVAAFDHGQPRAAEVDVRAAARILRARGRDDSEAMSLAAQCLLARGRHREALRAFEENLTAVERRGGVTAAHRALVGQALLELGRVERAAEQYLRALAEVRAHPYPLRVEADIAEGLGRTAGRLGRPVEALDWFFHAARTRARFGWSRVAGSRLGKNIAWLCEGPRPAVIAAEALPPLGALFESWSEGRHPEGRLWVGQALVRCLLLLARRGEALGLARSLVTEAAAPDDDLWAKACRFYGETFLDEPELRQECLELLLAVRDFERERLDAEHDADVRAERVGELLPLYESLLRLLVHHGDELDPPDQRGPLELAFDLHEEIRSLDVVSDLAAAPLPEPAQVPEHLLAAERSQLAAARMIRDVQSVSRMPSHLTAYVAHGLGRTQDKLYTAMLPYAPDYVRLRTAKPASLAEVSALLAREAPDEGLVLVSYFCGPSWTFCFVLDSRDPTGDVRVHGARLSRAEVADAAVRMRRAVNGDPEACPPTPPLHPRRPHRRDLGFLEPVADRALPFQGRFGGRALVALAPHGPLGQLPMAALPLPDDSRLGEHHPVVHLPSLTTLRYVLLGEAPGPPVRPLVVGVAGRGDRVADFERDGDLFHEQGPVRVLTGTDATPDAVLSALPEHDLAHITCHGYADTDDPLDSCVLLSDGRARPDARWEGHDLRDRLDFLLRARDLARGDGAPRTVVLRACSTGWSSPDHQGEDLTGLTRGLLRAGARTVLAPVWNTDRGSSAELLTAFHRHRLAGQPAWRALWLAQRALAQDPERRWLAHPYHWAVFTLTGDWR
ncbi:CHAT domain-containing protein [Streptomyces sp. NPDC057877]|uniref:CHAT domain-containing protein n=1 Tax=Streptomyces sp. NPDC057877 TaxID=3346269 RepID=UPI003682FD2E